MPYIGNPPAERFTSFAYQDLTGGSGTSFTLDNAVGNPQEIEVFVNNVRQEPGVAYTVSGTALTMTGSIASTDDFYVVFQGKAIQTATHPSDRALTATDGTFTGNTSVTGSATVSGDLTVDTNTLKVDVNNNKVGINTASPGHPLTVTAGGGTTSTFSVNPSSGLTVIGTSQSSATNSDLYIDTKGTGSHIFRYNAGGAEIARFTSSGLAIGGTGAANTLDDYEEGTWTGTLIGTTSNPSTSVTATGYYVKIGEKVSCTIQFTNVNTTGAAGSARVNGLPFTSNRIWVGGNAMFYAGFNINNITGNVAPYHPGDQQVSFYQSSDSAGWGEVTHDAKSGVYLWFTVEYAVSLS